MTKIGFREAKKWVIAALESGDYQHVSRDDIETKNLLEIGAVSTADLVNVILKCRGQHHSSSPHHSSVENVEVHLLERDGWYIKFYFVDFEPFFISVHQ